MSRRRPDPAGPEAALLAAGATVTRVRGPAAAPRRHKYGARATVVDSIAFPSRREARRYGELKVLERAGEIHSLRLQVPFDLSVRGKKIGRLILDFVYDTRAGETVYEDVKSRPTITPVFRWKMKHFEAQYRRKVTLVL